MGFDFGNFFVAIIFIAGYMLPSIIAGKRNHHNGRAIMWLNILLGWTFIGWVVALVWSLTETHEKAHT